MRDNCDMRSKYKGQFWEEKQETSDMVWMSGSKF